MRPKMYPDGKGQPQFMTHHPRWMEHDSRNMPLQVSSTNPQIVRTSILPWCRRTPPAFDRLGHARSRALLEAFFENS